MSSYRPKSLEELNSRYDQVISADKAIKKGVSGIRESESAQKESAAESVESFEAESLVKKAAGTKNVEDISGAVDDFIRHLNSEYAVQPRRQEPIRQEPVRQEPARPQTPPQSRPVVHREEAAAPAAPTRTAKPGPSAVPEPTSGERSDLLDDYMKVMTDQYEDEDDFAGTSSTGGYLKRKGRKRRKDKSAPPTEPQAPAVKEEPAPLPDVDYDDADYMAKTAEVLPQNAEIPEPDFVEPEAEKAGEETAESLDEAFDRLDSRTTREKSKKKTKGGKGRVVLRTLLSLMLAAVIAVTAAVASLVLVLKVNTGNLVFDQYYFVTTTADFEEAHLKAGDLVICEANESIADNRFVLCVDRSAGSFFFGKKNGGMVDAQGNIMYLIDGQNIYKDSVLGSVKRSFGHVGAVIDLIFRYYIPVLAALLVAAIGLILIVAIALRNKNKPVKSKAKKQEEYEEIPDTSEEEQELREAEEEVNAAWDFQDEPDAGQKNENKPQKSKKKKNKKRRSQEQPSSSGNAEEEPSEEESAEEADVKFDSDFDSFSDI